MSARAAALVAGGDDHERWAQAGDQLYVDLDLSQENLPAGTRLAVGDAVLEVTPSPHLGCGKFSRRFGVDALKFVNSAVGRELRLRGVNTRVVEPGAIAPGNVVRKLSSASD
jgi:MOSC domain-containing protein YiiM